MIEKFHKLPCFLKYFTVILISSFFLGFGLLYDLARRNDFDSDFTIFVVTSMLVNGFVGLAILSQKKWGLIVFKCYLYVLFLAIPVGTYISYKTFQYMEKNSIANMYE
jgi:hypothetical protein